MVLEAIGYGVAIIYVAVNLAAIWFSLWMTEKIFALGAKEMFWIRGVGVPLIAVLMVCVFFIWCIHLLKKKKKPQTETKEEPVEGPKEYANSGD